MCPKLWKTSSRHRMDTLEVSQKPYKRLEVSFIKKFKNKIKIGANVHVSNGLENTSQHQDGII